MTIPIQWSHNRNMYLLQCGFCHLKKHGWPPRFSEAVVFVDNAGCDGALGVLPLPQALLNKVTHVTHVVLAANVGRNLPSFFFGGSPD
jgi:hypothetical protein